MSRVIRVISLLAITLICNLSRAEVKNIYVTNISNSSISVFGFKLDENNIPDMYLQQIWSNPNPFEVFVGKVAVNSRINRYGYVFNGTSFTRLNFDRANGKISSSTETYIPFLYTDDVVFGPSYSKDLYNKLYIFGRSGINGQDMQVNVLDLSRFGELKSVQDKNFDKSGQKVSSVVFGGNNIEKKYNAYVLSRVAPNHNFLETFKVRNNGEILYDHERQREELRNKEFGPLAIMPGVNPKYVFLPVKDEGAIKAIMLYRRNEEDGTLTFKYWILTNDQTPIKVIPSLNGRFIYVLTANRTILVYSVPEDDTKRFKFIDEFLVPDAASGDVVDGDVGNVFYTKHDGGVIVENYLFVLVSGSNKLINFKLEENGGLAEYQIKSTGGYSSQYMALRNGQ